MESNRFVRILWTVNGVLLFFAFVFILIVTGKEIFENGSSYQQPQIIVGEELAEAKKEGLILQGLEYHTPELIDYSDFYILPVSLKTYQNPKKNAAFEYASADIEEIDDVVNVIFLNHDLEPVRTLLDRKAFINSMRYPGKSRYEYEYEAEVRDTIQRHITYEIAFEDSNKDGRIDSEDYLGLYVSKPDGLEFSTITSDVNVSAYEFLDQNRILVKYTERTDEDVEHRREYFAVYNIDQKSLQKLSSLHKSLDDIEKLITQ
jgi:hypothetical protein